MADRIFSILLLLVAIGYELIAIFIIKAPFQYDPLGPESWPRLLGFFAILCTLTIIIKPDVERLNINKNTAIRIFLLIIMLLIYVKLFQPLGFIFSTWLFCSALCIMLGGDKIAAIVFGGVTGIVGYFMCTQLLELNLPAGILATIL